MPIECTQLENAPVQLVRCPACGQPFRPFLRGLIQRHRRSWLGLGKRRPYCAMICFACKEIVGYENPLEPAEFELKTPILQ